MIAPFRFAWSVVLLTLACGTTLRAQQLTLPVRQIGVANGLPQNSVYSLFQDRTGFIWIGTGDGLARWDGKTFRTFRGRYNDSSGHSLAARVVSGKMAEDSQGRLWMTTSNGLTSYGRRTQQFANVALTGDCDLSLLRIAGLSASDVLYCYDGNNAWAVQTSSGQVTQLPLSLANNERIYRMEVVDDRPYVQSSQGLFVWSSGKRMKAMPVLSEGLSAFFGDDSGRLHLIFKDRIVVAKKDAVLFHMRLPDAFQRQAINWLEADNALGYYGQTRNNLFRLKLHPVLPAYFQLIPFGGDPTRTISSPLIGTVMLDRSKNLWVGTESGGLNIVDTKGFKFHTFLPDHADGKKPTEFIAKSLLEVGGRIWIGTFNRGLYELDRNSGTVSQQHAAGTGSVPRVSLLYRDSDGRIWMNREGTLGIVDTVTKAFRSSASIPENASGNIAAQSFCQTGKNTFLLGSTFRLHLVTVLPHDKISIRPVADGHPATTGLIAAICRYKDGSYFIGKVRGGFYRIKYDLSQSSVTVVDEGLHQTGIRDFQYNRDSSLIWMASENGLVAYDPERRQVVSMLDEQDGLSNSHIYCIVQAADNTLWVSSNKGLNRIKYTYSTGQKLQVAGVTSYTAKDGLQSNEFNTGAACSLSDGAIAFGGVAGINWFYPGHILTNPYPPQVAITGIKVNELPYQSRSDYDYVQQVSLAHDKNTLAFSFAALEYTNPEANRYTYMLQGFDQDWVTPGSTDEARYANLPPGNYTFLARAANNDGIWSRTPATLGVSIAPPWWQTLWARLSALMIIIAVLTGLVRFYVRRKVATRLRTLEKQQAVNEERLRISRDMHDELGTGLTKIALLSEVARRKAGADQPVSLGEIASTSRQLTQKIGEIVWTLNPGNDTLDTLAAYLREYLREQYDAVEDVAIQIDFPEVLPGLPLSHSLRQALLLVTKEAVNNAVKYSGSRLIIVSLLISNDRITFTVADHGCGFIPQQPKPGNSRGNGLGNMAARLKELGGTFRIVSAPGAGTTIHYSVPHPGK